jgi:hypothetical protein
MKYLILSLFLLFNCSNINSFELSGVWYKKEIIHPSDQIIKEFSWGESIMARTSLVIDQYSEPPRFYIGGFGSFPIKSIEKTNDVYKVVIDFTRGGFDIECIIHVINDNQFWIEDIDGISMFSTGSDKIYYRINVNTYIQYGILNDSRVRVRELPSLDSDSITYLNEGDRIEIIDQSEEPMRIGEMESVWYKIKTSDGTIGWTYGYFIDIE